MNEVFKSLEEAKQERILNAAYEEFSSHGYAKASTNRIIKSAGISKGMLFYYFNSKQELFEDLVDIGTEYLNESYLGMIDEQETDFLEKYHMASMIKLQAYHRNRHLFEFLGNIYLHGDQHILSAQALQKMEQLQKVFYMKLYGNIDTSMFRGDIPAERVMQLIIRCMSGYEKELTDNFKRVDWKKMDLQIYWDEFDVFLEDLRKLFYDSQK